MAGPRGVATPATSVRSRSGVYDDDGKLRFVGKVGSGFTGAIRADLLQAPQAAGPGRPAVRSAATQGLPRPVGRRPPGHHVGRAGARHPGRARWLDARRPRPPDGLQGHRAGSRPQVPSIARPRSPRPARSGPPKRRNPRCRPDAPRPPRSARPRRPRSPRSRLRPRRSSPPSTPWARRASGRSAGTSSS